MQKITMLIVGRNSTVDSPLQENSAKTSIIWLIPSTADMTSMMCKK